MRSVRSRDLASMRPTTGADLASMRPTTGADLASADHRAPELRQVAGRNHFRIPDVRTDSI